MAISEDQSTMVIGAPADSLDENGANFSLGAGAAFVYIKSGGSWIFQQKLVGVGTNSRNTVDKFGISVGISGDTIVVGASTHDYDATGATSLNDAGAIFIYTRSAGVWSLQQKVVAEGTNARDTLNFFGASVSISGDTIVVGATGNRYDADGANPLNGVGAAFVYTRSGTVWSQQQKLVGTGTNGRAASDNFGVSVSISGDTIAIGADQHDYDANGINGLNSAGAVFIYKRTTGVWNIEQKIVAQGTNARQLSDNFGYSVAVDSDTIVVGSYLHNYDEIGSTSTSDAGALFVYVRSAGVWSLQQKLVAFGTFGRSSADWLGYRVAVSGDTIAATAYQQDYDASGANPITNVGAVYVYSRSGGVWSNQQKITPTGTNSRVLSDKFGIGIAVRGDTVVGGASGQDYDVAGTTSISGAGAGYIFERSGGVWAQTAKVVDMTDPAPRMGSYGNYFGYSVSVSEDESTMVVGALNDSTDENGLNYVGGAGAVYVYVKSGGVWVFQQKIVPSGTNERTAAESFGNSVGISGDTIVIGAPLHSYDASGGSYLNGAGAAYIYKRSSGVWSLEQKLVGVGTNGRVALDQFGGSVAIDGDSVVIGATGQDYDAAGAGSLSGAGAAFVFTRSGTTWSLQQKLVGSGTNGRVSSDSFGRSVAINGDTVAIGVSAQDYDAAGANVLSSAGAVYVFARSAGTWSLQQKITPTGTNSRISSDNFGVSVAVSGDVLAVGADGQDFDESGANSVTSAGAAWVFTRSAGVWSQQKKLVATGTNARNNSDGFGGSIATNGSVIVVGAQGHAYDALGANQLGGAGAAFIFTGSGATWSQSQKIAGGGINGRGMIDNFGAAVAIRGNTIAAGAMQQDYDANGATFVHNAGAAFIYQK
ncbi:beta strand repeat-containing protein [Bdellovibrio sp. HCB2-146]|uniref:beta strand repeat-containing protein n=1 Tax=Bdellovibrio sp. HCB2-146 TaxID=3394362 RepID=UPI0039BC9227